MKRHRLLILVMVFAVLLPVVALAGAEIRITTDPGWQYLPAISGNKVVWYDNRNTGNQSDWDIYLYDVTTGIESRITTTPVHGLLGAPAISGNRIVWADSRAGNWDIYLYDITAGVETQITSDPANQFHPAISGDRIVWEDDRNAPAGSHDIYLYDLASGIETQITSNSSFEQSPSISGDRIVWEDNRNGNWDIYLYDITSGVTTQITTDTHHQWHPKISGDTIAWEDDRNCNDPQCDTFSGNWDIYRYDLSTGTEFPVTTDTSNQSNLSISGNRIVWEDKRNASPFNYDIYMYDLTTGTESSITMDSYDQVYPAISGDRIVWADNRSGNWDIFQNEFFSEAPGWLTALATSPSDDWLPVWSPDGTKILFSSNRSGNYDLWVMNADGSNLQQLTTDPAADLVPDWSPDGARILFNSTRGGNWDLWIMNADGSNPTQITFDHADYGHPRWSPDGTRIAFNSIRGGSSLNIWTVDADGSNMSQLTSNSGDNVSAEWSPDGSKISFGSNRSGNYDVWVMNADGSEQTQLTSDPADERSGKWHPDGPKMLFTRSNNGQSDIWIMNTDGSNQEPLLVTPFHEYQPDVSPDGTKIVFTSSRFGTNDIWVVELTQKLFGTYVIVAIAGPGGSITPSGKVPVIEGGSQTFTITADVGYAVLRVVIDRNGKVPPVEIIVGNPKDPSRIYTVTYTFKDVRRDHTIEAAFTESYCIVTAYTNDGGSIDPPKESRFPALSSPAYTITPMPGYFIANVYIDRVPVGAVGTYTFSDILADHIIEARFAPSVVYAITATAGAGGSIDPPGTSTISLHSSQTFTITADAGYQVFSVIVDGANKGAVGSYNFPDIQASHTIAAYFKAVSYTITASAAANGSISSPGVNPVNPGSSMNFTITPSAGYHVADVLVDSVSSGPTATYAFSNIQANHTIAASFAENDWFLIDASAGANGSISPSGSGSVLGGTNQKYTITPASGYRVADVVVDGASKGALASYTFYDVQAAHTITVTFTPDVYTITTTVTNYDSSTPGNGSIMVNGSPPPATVNAGAGITYTITPNPEHVVYSVLVDGTQQGGITSFTFPNVQANHTIAAYVRPVTYAVTANPGAGGSITPVGTSTFDIHASPVYTITAAAGYHIAAVAVDGVPQGAVGSYPFTDITANHTIAATFAANTGIAITATAGPNGSISPAGSVSVNAGASQTFSFTPDAGYRISDVVVDGSPKGALTSYTFYSVQADHTISVSYVLDVYSINVTAALGGGLTVSGASIPTTTVNGGESSTITVNPGEGVTLTITPDAGRSMRSVIDDGANKGAVTTYTLTNIKKDHTINVYFR